MSEARVAAATLGWHQLPNALSLARIAAAPVLVLLALAGSEYVYSWLLVAALVSDIADGLIARLFRWQSPLGAKLDSVGDMLVVVAALAGIGAFHPELYRDHWPGLAAFLGAGLAEYVLSLWRYGRLSSFHTLLSKAAGTLLAAFLAVLFVHDFLPWLFYLGIGVGVLASLEEMLLIALLPDWRANVRGAWSLLRERRS